MDLFAGHTRRPSAWAQEARGGDIAGSMATTSNAAMRNLCPSRQAVG